MSPELSKEGFLELTKLERESLRGTKVFFPQGNEEAFRLLGYYLRANGMLPIYSIYSLENERKSWAQLISDSEADAVILHCSSDRQVEMVMDISEEFAERMIIFTRNYGGVTEKMRRGYKKMEKRGMKLIEWSTSRITENLLLAIWQCRNPGYSAQ